MVAQWFQSDDAEASAAREQLAKYSQTETHRDDEKGGSVGVPSLIALIGLIGSIDLRCLRKLQPEPPGLHRQRWASCAVFLDWLQTLSYESVSI